MRRGEKQQERHAQHICKASVSLSAEIEMGEDNSIRRNVNGDLTAE